MELNQRFLTPEEKRQHWRSSSPNFINRVGERFGKLVVIRFSHKVGKMVYWLCRCDCGSEKAIRSGHLVSGRTVSCNCAKRTPKSHGKTYDRIYTVYQRMMSRCYCKKNIGWKNYGGRGIKVCERWHKFENFLEDMGEPTHPKLTIERIDVDGNYEPSNCRWATYAEQARNKTNNHLLRFQGVTKCLSDWAQLKGIPVSTLANRLWLVNRKISINSNKKGCKK